MQTSFDPPVLPHGTGQPLDLGRQAACEITHLIGGLAGCVISAVAKHHDQTRQARPQVRGNQLLWSRYDNGFPRFCSTLTLRDLRPARLLLTSTAPWSPSFVLPDRWVREWFGGWGR